jgi:Protein of unknown function (DUF3040)
MVFLSRRSRPDLNRHPKPPPAGTPAELHALAGIRDDLVREDPGLAGAYARFGERSVARWARPGPWCLGSPLALTATALAVRFLGLVVLGVLTVLLVLGGLVLVAAASPSTSGPPED